jgi:WD40 repeat protein
MITFQPHTASVTALAFSADGSALASVSHDRWVKVWDVASLACQSLRWEKKGSDAGLNHCQFAPNGRELFTGGSDGIVRVWATADGKLLRASAPETDLARTTIYAFVLARSGRELAWCGYTGRGTGLHQIVVARTSDLAVIQRLPAHDAGAMILAAHPDGFCSGSVDRTVKFWDWTSATCHRTLKARGVVRALAVSPDGTRVAVGGVSFIAIHTRTGFGVAGKPVHLRGHTKCIECIEFSPDGSRLASVSLDRTLRLWDVATGECVRTFALGLGGLHWVTFAPDGLTAAFSSIKGDIGLLDLDE